MEKIIITTEKVKFKKSIIKCQKCGRIRSNKVINFDIISKCNNCGSKSILLCNSFLNESIWQIKKKLLNYYYEIFYYKSISKIMTVG